MNKTKRKITKKTTKRKRTNKNFEFEFINYSIPELLKKHRKLTKGAGNFENPRTPSECYEPLTRNTFKFERYSWSEFRNLLFTVGESIGEGSYNRALNITPKGICRYINKPIMCRMSKYMLDLSKTKQNMIQHEFQYEMYRYASLPGITPDVYICGLINANITSVIPFAIMQKFDMDMYSFLKDKSYKNYWETAIMSNIHLYDKLSRYNICDLDVKSLNVVVSLPRNRHQTIDVRLIDISTDFHMDYPEVREKHGKQVTQELLYLTMTYMYLQSLIKLFNLTHVVYPGKLEKIVMNALKHVYNNYYYPLFYSELIKEYYRGEKVKKTLLRQTFEHYGYDLPPEPTKKNMINVPIVTQQPVELKAVRV